MTGNAPFLLSSPLLTLEWGNPPVYTTYSIHNHDDPETYTQFREDRPQTPQAQFFMIKRPNLAGYFGSSMDGTLLEINLFPHVLKAAVHYANDHPVTVPCTSILWLVMLEDARDVHGIDGYASVNSGGSLRGLGWFDAASSVSSTATLIVCEKNPPPNPSRDCIVPVRAPLDEPPSPMQFQAISKPKISEVALLQNKEGIQPTADEGDPERQDLYLTIKVVTDDSFSRQDGFDVATFHGRKWTHSDLITFRVLKREAFREVKKRITGRFDISADAASLWVIADRQNLTSRPHTLITESELSLTVETLRHTLANKFIDLRLYLDTADGVEKLGGGPGVIMVFLKHFDTYKQKLVGAGTVHLRRTAKVSNLFSLINKRMRWTPGTRLTLYEEIKPGMILAMKPNLTLDQSEIQNGDIICFQADISGDEISDLERRHLFSNPVQYYDSIQNGLMVLFRPKLNTVPGNDHPTFSLVMSTKDLYDTMAHKAGKRLRHHPAKLRFTATDETNGSLEVVLKRSQSQTIPEIISLLHSSSVILYEKLDDISPEEADIYS